MRIEGMAESSTKVPHPKEKNNDKKQFCACSKRQIQIQVNYTKTPPQAFLSKLVSECSSEKCMEDLFGVGRRSTTRSTANSKTKG